MKKLLLIVPLVALAACDAPTTGGDAPAMSAVSAGGAVRGSYAVGTPRETVMAAVNAQCAAGFDDFLEFPASGGMVSYTATCS